MSVACLIRNLMDTILEFHDKYFLTPYVYPRDWAEGSWTRQYVSLFVILNYLCFMLYFTLAGLNYWLLYDKRLLQHPLFLDNQIKKEIGVSCRSIPVIGIPTAALFLLQIRGYSKLYRNEEDIGWTSLLLTLVGFILFTDFGIYCVHQGLHSRWLYKSVHKTHHQWKVPTPFASHAVEPAEGFLLSAPYHLFVFIFPMHKNAFLAMFVLVNIWSVSVHDGDFRVPRALRPFVNGSAHHAEHHLHHHFNFGQFFTLWDRLGRSFREPMAYSENYLVDQVVQSGSEVIKDE